MPAALVIAPNWIGDAVMAQPLLAGLHAQGLQIDVLATPWVAPIFSACPEVNEVITADFKHGGIGFGLRKKIAKELQQKKYDQAYVLPNSWKSALIPWLAKIPIRIGYRGEMRFGLLNHRLENPPKKHRPSMVKHYALLASLNPIQSEFISSFNASIQTKTISYPRLQVSQTQCDLERQKLKVIFPEANSFYVLAPGAEYGPAKQWPLEHFTKLALQILRQNTNNAVIIMGSAKDEPAGKLIVDQIQKIQPELNQRIKNFCGEITLTQSIAIVSFANGMASNDSGMMHVAAAFNIPQVAFFGSSDPKHTPPLSENAKALWLGLDCSPCHKRQCPLGHLRCLKDISPETAFQALQEQINKKG